MFNKKENVISSEEYRELLVKSTQLDYENIRLKGELENLKLENNTLKNAEGKSYFETKIKTLESNIKSLENEKEKLQSQYNKLEIQIKQDEINTDLRYKNREQAEEIKSLKTIIEYKDKMVKELQSLPDVQIMIKNLQSLSVPGMEELEKFANIVKGNNLDTLDKKISMLIDEFQRLNSPRGYR